MTRSYAVVIEKAEHSQAAYVPDLSGCISSGGPLEQAEQNIHKAVCGHIATRREFGNRAPATTKANFVEINDAA